MLSCCATKNMITCRVTSCATIKTKVYLDSLYDHGRSGNLHLPDIDELGKQVLKLERIHSHHFRNIGFLDNCLLSGWGDNHMGKHLANHKCCCKGWILCFCARFHQSRCTGDPHKPNTLEGRYWYWQGRIPSIGCNLHRMCFNWVLPGQTIVALTYFSWIQISYFHILCILVRFRSDRMKCSHHHHLLVQADHVQE